MRRIEKKKKTKRKESEKRREELNSLPADLSPLLSSEAFTFHRSRARSERRSAAALCGNVTSVARDLSR